uniref:Carbonic anhydrase n=1 Tax=Cynoglossus semilaevis TaxID=244447 RepID=A0A3P8WVJ9_CYNSE
EGSLLCVFLAARRCKEQHSLDKAWNTELDDAKWPEIAPQFCNGSRQSPINIATSAVKPDSKLTAFTFENFHRKSVLKTITNTGKTVDVFLNIFYISLKGGDLPEEYDSLQFHLHWGNGASVPGSEHTVDGKRYPMELHIVNIKSSYNGNTTLGVADSMGLAALGFFIEGLYDGCRNKILKADWTYCLLLDDSVSMDQDISLDDLLDGVNRTKYFRYLGSLTTPNCNEAVVWTVFKETIKVSKDLINLFSTTLHTSDSASPIMIDVYRNIQPDQKVTTQPGNNSNSLSTNYYSLAVLLALNLMQFMNW